MQPARNFRCIAGGLGECTEKIGFSDWKNEEVIGEGAFGKVSKYNVNFKGKPIEVAVKVVVPVAV